MAKSIGFGASLTVDDTTGANSTIAQIRSISVGEASGDAVDSTVLGSTSGKFREFIGGMIDPGEVTIELIYDPSDTSHKKLARFHKARTAYDWSIVYPTTDFGSDTFSGFVNSLGAEIPLDDLITCSVTIKKSGFAGFST